VGESDLAKLAGEIAGCRACPRLVAYREKVAREKVARHAGETYWGRPVPGFGRPDARLWVLGLAPAAHGGNRTGRPFTGDKSGDFLFRALFEAGFCNQPASTSRSDGLELNDLYISAVVRCAPPDNKPDPREFDACRPFLIREFRALDNLSLVLVLGAIAYREYRKIFRETLPSEKISWPPFSHGLFVPAERGRPAMLASYHPSARNTQTGRLTLKMMGEILVRAREILSTVRILQGLRTQRFQRDE